MIPTVPVKIENWTPTAYGVISILILQLVVLTGWAIRKGPDYIAAWAAAKKQGAEDERLDEDRAVAAANSLNTRVAALETRVQNLGSSTTFLANAVTLAVNALETENPNNLAIAQCRELVAMAAATIGDQDPFGQALARLGGLPGVRHQKAVE